MGLAVSDNSYQLLLTVPIALRLGHMDTHWQFTKALCISCFEDSWISWMTCVGVSPSGDADRFCLFTYRECYGRRAIVDPGRNDLITRVGPLGNGNESMSQGICSPRDGNLHRAHGESRPWWMDCPTGQPRFVLDSPRARLTVPLSG